LISSGNVFLAAASKGPSIIHEVPSANLLCAALFLPISATKEKSINAKLLPFRDYNIFGCSWQILPPGRNEIEY